MEAQTENDGYRNLEGYRTALEEMQLLLEHQYERLKEAKSTARTILISGSFIVAIIGTLQIFNEKPEPFLQMWYEISIGIAITLYLLLIGFCVWILLPAEIWTPIKGEFEVLYDAFIGKRSEMEILDQQLLQRLIAIEKNEPTIRLKKDLSIAAGVCLALIVVILMGINIVF